MCDQRDAAIARAKNLAEALEPFAQLAGWVDVAGDEESCTPPLPDRYLLTWTATVKPEGIDHLPGHPTVGDCRRAAEVLALAVEMREGVP